MATSHFHDIPKNVPGEIHPLMGAFISYHLRVDNTKHGRDHVKKTEPMIWKLLCFFKPEYEGDSCLKRYVNKDKRRQELKKLVTNDDGTFMTAEQQMKLFADLVSNRTNNLCVVYLYRHINSKPDYKTDEESSGHLNLPVIKWPHGGYAGTSRENIFCIGNNKFCYNCNIEYESESKHRMDCKERCKWCFKMSPDGPCKFTKSFEDRIKCQDCQVSFRSETCYEQHFEKACKWRKLCLKCYQHYNTAAGKHMCGCFYCRSCKTIHKKNNKYKNEIYCYINSTDLKKKDFDRVGYFFFDFETIQNESTRKRKRPHDPDEDEQQNFVCTGPVSSRHVCSQECSSRTSSPMLHAEFDDNPHHQLIKDYDIRFDRPQNPISSGIRTNPSDSSRIRLPNNALSGSNFTDMIAARIDPPSNKKLHSVNTATCISRCSDCLMKNTINYECNYCGYGGVKKFTSVPCSPELAVFVPETSDITPLDKLTDEIIKASQNPNISELHCFSHYGSRFDNHLVVKNFAKKGYQAEIRMRGLTLFQATFKPRGEILKTIHLKDTWRFMPVALKSFKQTFGLSDNFVKLDYPHLINQKVNYHLNLPTLPDKHYYGYNGLTKKQRDEFDLRYHEEKLKMYQENKRWLFVEELIKYAAMDTIILWKGFQEYSKILNELTKSEVAKFTKPLSVIGDLSYYNCCNHGSTIASISIYLMKLMHIEDNMIPYIPETGYTDQTNASKIAISWLDFIAKETNTNILHKDNNVGGEVKFGDHRVDGWDMDNNIAYQIHGCRWHACKECYPRGSTVLFDGKSCDEIRANDDRKLKNLERAFDGHIEIIWECSIRKKMKEDDTIKKWVESRPDTSCIDLRASLQGGRTGPSRLSAKSVVGKEIIKYFDICSLYPFICSFFDLPTHHPRIVAGSQPYRTPEDVPFGLIKCKVLAPNQKIPTLGVKRHSMLIFANCNKCIELYGKPDKKKPKKNVGRISCTCTDEEREMVVTVTSEELKFAMMTGTVVKEVYHSLEYDKTSNKIFLPFIQSFLKIKTESSHPPADFNTYEGKRRFVDTYKSLYGITIDPENCAFNPGKRFISKIFLNSIWGRFSFQANQAEKDIITPQEFVALTKDETVFDLAAFEFEDNVLMANYKRDVNFVNASNTSIIISIFVTSYARLWLLRFMRQIEGTPGCSILYVDTDSCIFLVPDEDSIPFKTGDMLGMMVDEWPDHFIDSYQSGGAKNYRLELRSKKTNDIDVVTKIRGITMNAEAERLITREAFNFDPTHNIPIQQTLIGPANDFTLWTTDTTKNYRTVCHKSIIFEDVCYPLGYRFDEPEYAIILTEYDDTDVEKIIRKSQLQT